MKYIMSFVQVGWWCKTISYWSDSFKNIEWPYEARWQLGPLSKLYGKLSKYSFFQKEIHYLGHIISREGILVVESLLYLNAIMCEKEVEDFVAELLQKESKLLVENFKWYFKENMS